MSVDTYALTTLANAQEYVGDSDPAHATLIERLVDGATVAMERYCGRKFKERSYSEWLDGLGAGFLYLPNYPVTVLNRVCTDVFDVLEVWNTSTDATGASVRTTATGIVLQVFGGANNGSDTLAYATYTTVTLLDAAIKALGKGWTCSIWSDYGSLSTADIKVTLSGKACLTNTIASHRAQLQLPTGMLEDVDLGDGLSGRIVAASGFPYGHNRIFVQYTAGYNTTSHNADLRDLEDICLQIVKLWHSAMERDGALQSESLGDYSYTIASDLQMLSGLDPGTFGRLSLYRRVML